MAPGRGFLTKRERATSKSLLRPRKVDLHESRMDGFLLGTNQVRNWRVPDTLGREGAVEAVSDRSQGNGQAI